MNEKPLCITCNLTSTLEKAKSVDKIKSRLSTSTLFPNPIELISSMNTYCLTLLSGCKYLISFEIATELFTHNKKLFNLVKGFNWHITVRFQSGILVQDLRFLVM